MMDLHTHSTWSDGTLTPAQLAQAAAKAKLKLLALTDHDTMNGLSEAAAACKAHGVGLVPALELDTQFSGELHILGLGVEPSDPLLAGALENILVTRGARNREILARLAAAGVAIDPASAALEPLEHCTRLNIAVALCGAGFAKNIADAFERYLLKGRVGYVSSTRQSPEEAITLIHAAGGKAVIAHPHKLRSKEKINSVLARLLAGGLDGVEAYYPGMPPQLQRFLLEFAKTHNLMVTCGSDFHGQNRPEAQLGSAFESTAPLRETYAYFAQKYN